MKRKLLIVTLLVGFVSLSVNADGLNVARWSRVFSADLDCMGADNFREIAFEVKVRSSEKGTEIYFGEHEYFGERLKAANPGTWAITSSSHKGPGSSGYSLNFEGSDVDYVSENPRRLVKHTNIEGRLYRWTRFDQHAPINLTCKGEMVSFEI